MLIPYNLVSIFFAAMAANLGWRFGSLIWDQLEHWTHLFLRWAKKDYELGF